MLKTEKDLRLEYKRETDLNAEDPESLARFGRR
jgi:hypothetical protein